MVSKGRFEIICVNLLGNFVDVLRLSYFECLIYSIRGLGICRLFYCFKNVFILVILF